MVGYIEGFPLLGCSYSTQITSAATGLIMHLDKAKKRIAKQVKKGFHGYLRKPLKVATHST